MRYWHGQRLPIQPKKEKIMITIIANESTIADLINQEFEDMLRSYEWEQENKWASFS